MFDKFLAKAEPATTIINAAQADLKDLHAPSSTYKRISMGFLINLNNRPPKDKSFAPPSNINNPRHEAMRHNNPKTRHHFESFKRLVVILCTHAAQKPFHSMPANSP